MRTFALAVIAVVFCISSAYAQYLGNYTANPYLPPAPPQPLGTFNTPYGNSFPLAPPQPPGTFNTPYGNSLPLAPPQPPGTFNNPYGNSFNAYAANPSAVPTEAQAAGFTTLAADYDFSQPLYATQSNWFDCNGSQSSLFWHKGNPGVSMPLPCNVFQTTDGGNTVMDSEYLTSYNGITSGQFSQVGGQTFDNFNKTVSVDFPNMYIETVARIATTYGTPQNSGGPNDVWTWDNTPNHSLEIDVFELYEDSGGFGDGGTGSVHWYSYETNNLPGGWSPVGYHKYGALLTSDGATSRHVCMFVDDLLQGCSNEPATNFIVRNWIIMSAGSNSSNAGANIDMLVQYIRVWSCANWQSSMCNGSTLYNSGGLTYWH